MNAMLLADITTDETFGGWALSNVTLMIVGGAPASEMLTLRPSAGAKHEPWTSCCWPSIVAFPRAAAGRDRLPGRRGFVIRFFRIAHQTTDEEDRRAGYGDPQRPLPHAAPPKRSARVAQRKAGSAIDRVDDGHVLDRVFRRRLHRFAAQHRCGESVKLICVGGAVRETLHPFTVG